MGGLILNVVSLFMCVVSVTSLSFLDSEGAAKSDHVSLRIDRRSKSRRDAEDELHVTLTGADGPMRLRYRREIHRKFPVHLSGDTVREDTSGDGDWSVYTGVDHEGVVVVRPGADTPSGIELEGFVVKEDKWLTIQPVEGGDHIIHENMPSMTEDDLPKPNDNIRHDSEVDGLVMPYDDNEYDTIASKGHTDDHTDDVTKRDANTPDLTRKMEIELKINIDYHLYKRMYARTRGRFATEAEKKAKCITLLRQYYVFMISAMNIRYQSIRDAGMNLHVVVGGLLISDTINGSKWTTYDMYTNRSFDGRIAMTKFRNWLYHHPFFGKQDYDHWQIHSPRSVSWAGTNTMCFRYASYCHSNFNPVDAATGGHELLHTLGVAHDPGTKECPKFAIMHHTATLYGTFMVTNCTLRWLRASLTKRINNTFACLLTTDSSGEYTQVEKSLGVKLGQKYGIHEQCFFYSGVGYSAYSAINEKLCRFLTCRRGKYGRYMDPYPYTSCADKKWCLLGKCVFDQNAPMIDKHCPKGDFSECVTSVNATTLAQCYPGGNLARRCCKTCPRMKLSNTDCMYGDRICGCTSRNCTTTNEKHNCCETCAKVKGAKVKSHG